MTSTTRQRLLATTLLAGATLLATPSLAQDATATSTQTPTGQAAPEVSATLGDPNAQNPVAPTGTPTQANGDP